MSFYISNFVFCIFFVFSSANSQTSGQFNIQQIKMEIFKINVKLSYIIDEIDLLKANHTCSGEAQVDQLIDQLSADLDATKWQSKNEIDTINKELCKLNIKDRILEQSMAHVTSQISHQNSGQEKLEQLIEQMSADVKNSKLQNDELKNEMNVMKKELSEQGKKNGITEQSLILVINREDSRQQREQELKNEISSINTELKRLNKSEETLKRSVFLTKPNTYLRLSDEYYKKEADFTWIVKDMLSKSKQTKFEVLSEVFALKTYSFGAQVRLRIDNGHVYVSLAYKDLKRGERALDGAIVPSAYFTFKDLSSKDRVRHASYAFKKPFEYDVFHYERWLSFATEVASDVISLSVHVEDPWTSKQAYSHDGSLTWAVEGYRKRKQMERESLVWYQLSPCFYTGPKGYRVQAHVRANGSEEHEGKGLTVDVYFLSGPHDKGLAASYPHRTTVTLLHPTDPSKHMVKGLEQNIDQKTHYRINIENQKEIEKLLQDDTLFYQIDIVPI